MLLSLTKRIGLAFTVSSLLIASIVHCSSDTTTNNNPPAANDASTSNPDGSNVATNDGGGDSGNPTSPTGGSGCGVEKLCLDVAITPTTAYRIAVVWFQLDDDGPDPAPEVAYDAPVTAGSTKIEILTSAVKAPTDEKVLLCERGGDDEAAFPCTSDPKVGYGVVVAYEDVDGDGKFSTGDKRVGGANAIFGYDANGFAAGAAPTRPDQWDRLWPNGVQKGVNLYQIERPDGSVFDRPIKSSAGKSNTLGEKVPNLT